MQIMQARTHSLAFSLGNDSCPLYEWQPQLWPPLDITGHQLVSWLEDPPVRYKVKDHQSFKYTPEELQITISVASCNFCFSFTLLKRIRPYAGSGSSTSLSLIPPSALKALALLMLHEKPPSPPPPNTYELWRNQSEVYTHHLFKAK